MNKTVLRCMSCFMLSLMLFGMIGCGHSTLTVDRGTGFIARIPLAGTNSNLIELKMGNIDSATAVLRGGATVAADVAKGGTFGTVSSGDHITMTTIPSINEGYVEKVLTSKDADPETKKALVNYLAVAKPLAPAPSAVSSVNAGAANGTVQPPTVKTVSTGIDKAIETAGDVAPKVVPPVVEGVKDVTSNVTDTVKTVSNDTFTAIPKVLKEAKWLIVALVVLAIILIVVGLKLYNKYKAKKEEGDKTTPESSDNKQEQQ